MACEVVCEGRVAVFQAEMREGILGRGTAEQRDRAGLGTAPFECTGEQEVGAGWSRF